MSKPKAPTPDERAEQRQFQRIEERDLLVAMVGEIHENTEGEIEIFVSCPGEGTVLDSPSYPLVYALDVGLGFKDPKINVPRWTMTGTFGECVCFINGMQTSLMILSAMAQEYHKNDQGLPEGEAQ